MRSSGRSSSIPCPPSSWAPAPRRWVDATYLHPGSWLRTSAGTWIQVADVKRWTAAQQVFNLTIADVHTYHVLIGDVAVLVHNAERIPSFVTDMLRAIKDGSLGQRKNSDGSLDFYRYRAPDPHTGLGGIRVKIGGGTGRKSTELKEIIALEFSKRMANMSGSKTTTIRILDRSATSLHCEWVIR
ncbi:polymorphic toxin-type HINT domain-containing protein [Nonomuraea sp. NPDC049421]|uniref:polymorphic toxin-type HINT domain-containing protein n=1 Tax=Nonomuraea sp. NPDC049421 TaxID=3155275 RepID=UPI0034183E97